MKKMIVFGATGGTGKELVKQALHQGYNVIAIVREPSAFTMAHPLLTLIKGDVLTFPYFEEHLANVDVVISCLGTGKDLKETRVYSQGIQNILSAMENKGVGRLLCISAIALDTNKNMGFLIRFITTAILQKILKHVYSDMRMMEDLVEKSTIDWTIFRPPMLKDKPLSGIYRIAIGTHLTCPFSISRADLANGLLKSISNVQTFKTKVEIAY